MHEVPVWLLEGTWRAETSDRLLGDDEEGEPRQRPEHIPETVTLALGVEDLFPYRIEYRKPRAPSETSSLAESMIAAGAQSLSIMTLELFEVQTGQTIDPQMFSFQPTGVQIQDATDRFIRNQLASKPQAR